MHNTDKLIEKLAVCNKVDTMLESEGWKQIIRPRIEAMIAALSGSPHTSTPHLYTLGTTCLSKDDKEVWKNIGINIGMVQVYNMIMSHVVEKERIKKSLESQNELETRKDIMPMENSRYNLEQ